MQANSEVLALYKKLGETPLACLERFRRDNPDYLESNMTYLGRLDPVAEGLLLVLVGNTKDKGKYLDWDKTYEFEVLWGFETDTYDVLGLVSASSADSLSSVSARISSNESALLRKIRNIKTQVYPPYSSRTVGGKQLFQWAREGKIHEIDIPERGIKIFSLDHIHTRDITGREILMEITEKISLVSGDFRQKEILKKWKSVLKDKMDERFLVSKFRIDVSSGTYIRGLAHDMGKILDSHALAYSIKRTRVGDYKL